MKFVRSLMKAATLANVPKHIDHFSKFSPSPLSMKQFLDFGEWVSFMFTKCLHILIMCTLHSMSLRCSTLSLQRFVQGAGRMMKEQSSHLIPEEQQAVSSCCDLSEIVFMMLMVETLLLLMFTQLDTDSK